MGKKCIICEFEEAKYGIKGTSDTYCDKCAVDQFGDIGYLEKIEPQKKEKVDLNELIEANLADDEEEASEEE